MAADPGTLSQQAPAKVNLYLHLCGQRDDGYHLLDSLAVFPSVGDVLTAHADSELRLEISGPQSASLIQEGDNLILRAARGLRERSRLTLGARLHLQKNLPVASGIGGGSSDAAAALRLLSQLWQCEVPDDLALSLGADVPVCMAAPVPTRMQGIGEILTQAPALPTCAILLVNPGVEVPTGAVFSAVADKNPAPGPAMPDRFDGFADFVDWLRLQRNDLEPAARSICGQISEAVSALSPAPLARMSGSGATCFALLSTLAEAQALGQKLQARQPDWWIEAGEV